MFTFLIIFLYSTPLFINYFFMEYLLLILWFILLIKWADILVEWAGSIAKKFGISSLVIGLTIIAFGSSAPELVVNLFAATQGKTQLAIGNILGSNISNLLLIIWITSLISPLAMPHSTVKKEIPFMILAALILWGLLLNDGIISRYDALILSALFGYFLYYLYTIAKNNKSKQEDQIEIMSTQKSLLFTFGWLIGLIGWGKLIVDNAVSIASNLGLSEAFIWVTIVAIGTSLPELAATIMAAVKKNTDMAIGWVIGSNIFNTLWIIWATGLIAPLEGYEWMWIDIGVNILASFLILSSAFLLKKKMVDRPEGAVLLLLYISYITYLVINL